MRKYNINIQLKNDIAHGWAIVVGGNSECRKWRGEKFKFLINSNTILYAQDLKDYLRETLTPSVPLPATVVIKIIL